MRFLQRKMLDHEVHGRVHERLIQLVENLLAADTVPAESGLFRVFNHPKEYEEVFCGRHHLFGGDMVESLLGSSKKRSRMSETENEDTSKKKNSFNL